MWNLVLNLSVLFTLISTCTTYNLVKQQQQDHIGSKWRERKNSDSSALLLASAPSTSDNYYSNFKLRHHSRFLDTNSNKLNKVKSYHLIKTTTIPPTTTTENIFDDYYDDDDDEENQDNWDDDAANDEEYVDDEEGNNNEEEEEEITEEPSSVKRHEIQSPITKMKWDKYGTRAKVEESRRQHINNNNNQPTEIKLTSLVIDHFQRVQREGQCYKPQRRVIPVQSLHPDATRIYTPHCTILYRCAEDTGCCMSHGTKCGPKTQTMVHLPFYAKVLGKTETKIITLTFYNHTECACIDKSKLTATDSSSLSSNENLANYRSTGLVPKSGNNSPENIRHCKCPEEFVPKYHYTSRCSCDCRQDNEGCQRMKKGKEYFGLMDRKCIDEDRCGMPICEYGVYLSMMGRCQAKHEKLDPYRNQENTN